MQLYTNICSSLPTSNSGPHLKARNIHHLYFINIITTKHVTNITRIANILTPTITLSEF